MRDKFLCEKCKELYIDPAYGKGNCICAYSKEPKFPIEDNQRTDEYFWCEGRGYREQ